MRVFDDYRPSCLEVSPIADDLSPYASGYPICALVGLLAIQAALLVLTDTSAYSLPYWLHFFVIGGAASLIHPNIKVPGWISKLDISEQDALFLAKKLVHR